jgi:predicted nuclease of predicted toxin-antitoxin system
MIKTSNLKIVIDVGVGRLIEEWLSQQGFNIIAIRKINLEMSDSEIIKLANYENAIIITMDKDFGELVYKNHLQHKGIVLLRLEDAMGEEKLSVIQTIFTNKFSQLKNNFCVYQNGNLRIRK